MEVEAAHVRAGDGRSRRTVHDKRRHFVPVGNPDGVSTRVGQERIQPGVLEARVTQRGGHVSRDAAEGRGHTEDVCETFTQQAGVVGQSDLTIQRIGLCRIAASHEDQVGLIRHIGRKVGVRVLKRPHSVASSVPIRIDPDSEVVVARARVVGQDDDFFLVLTRRDAPRTLNGHQHSVAGREVGEVARRLEAREAPIDSGVHVRTELFVVRDHESQRRVVRDPAFHAASETDRVRPGTLLVRVHPRVGSQPRCIGRDWHAEFKVVSLEGTLNDLRSDQPEAVPEERDVRGESRGTHEVGLVGRRHVSVRPEVQDRTECFKPEADLVVAIVELRLVVVPVGVHTDDAVELLGVQA